MILHFKKVILHNFASYSHAEIDLSNKGFCLVSGRNYFKKDNSFSNGSGKSFIWSAISYTLTGETINGLQKGLKNICIDEDLCYTKLFFSADGNEYEITRYIAPKSDLHIIKDGVDVSGKGITESRKKLGELLPDLTKDLIASTFIIGQGMPSAFSKFSPSGRKEVLEKLTKSDYMIEEVKTRINNRMTVLNTQMRAHEDNLLVANTKLSTANDTVRQLTTRLSTAVKPDFAAETANTQKVIDNLDLQLVALTNLISKKLHEQSTVDEELTKLNTQLAAEIATINDNYTLAVSGGLTKKSTLAVEYNTFETEIRNLTAEINKIKNIKEFCPTCGQKLVGISKPSTIDLENALKEKQEFANAKQAELVVINKKLLELEAQKTTFLTDVKSDFASKCIPFETRKRELPTELSTLRANQNIVTANIATAKAKLNKIAADSESWDTNIEAMRQDLITAEKAVASLTKSISDETTKKLDTAEHIAILKKIETLTKRDLRGHLLTNIITYIDRRAKDFSEVVFGTRELAVTLDGNALDITYCGKIFDSLSGGEKMRVDLILQLAIRDMLKSYLNTHANILVLDEITDFLDKQSCAAVMKLIESELTTVESVFIISHHTDELDLPIDTELKITKDSSGISTAN